MPQLPSLRSLPRPDRVVTTAGAVAHRVLTGGLTVAQSVVDRLPGAPARPDPSTIGANPRRRYRSAGSRNLGR